MKPKFAIPPALMKKFGMRPSSRPEDPAPKRLALAALIIVGVLPFELNGIYNPLLAADPPYFWLADFAAYSVLPLFIFLIGTRFKIFTARQAGFHSDILWPDQGRKLLFCMFLLPFLMGIGYILFWSIGNRLFSQFPGQVYFSYHSMLGDFSLARIPKAIFLSLTAGVVEEFYYRGLFRLLFKRGWLNAILYVLISSLVFSSVHWEGGNAQLFATFWFGVMAAIFYLWIGNLWPLVWAHFLSDLFIFSNL